MTNPRLLAVILVGVIALGTLAGCAAEPASPSAAPTPSVTVTPTPTPTPEPVAERLVIDSQTMTVIANNGEALASYDYFQDPQQVATELTELIGLQPTSRQGPPYEGLSYLESEWPGFRLLDLDRETDGVFYTSYWVEVAAPQVGGLIVETVEGISVGDDSAAVESAHPDTTEHVTPPNTGIPRFIIRLDTVPLPTFEDGTDGYSFMVSIGGEVGLPIETIFAPSGGGPGI